MIKVLLAIAGKPDKMVGVDYPAQLWPVVGTLSLDKSVREGTDSLDEILQDVSGKTTVVGISQGAVVINYAKRRASASEPTDKITFVTLGDPTNADGGLLAKLPPVHIPVLDFTITPPPVATPHDTVEVVREFDGFADVPDRPFNMVANLNALAGVVYVHPNYGGLDLKDEDNVVTYSKNSLGGTTKHILVKTDQLPLTEPLRAIGVDDKVVDAIDKPLRRIINVAYDGPRPGKPANPEPLNNIRVKPNETRSGLNGVRSRPKQARSNLWQVGQIRSQQRQQRLANREHNQAGDQSPDSVAE